MRLKYSLNGLIIKKTILSLESTDYGETFDLKPLKATIV